MQRQNYGEANLRILRKFRCEHEENFHLLDNIRD